MPTWARSLTSPSPSRFDCPWSCRSARPAAGATPIPPGRGGGPRLRSFETLTGTLLTGSLHGGVALVPMLVLLALFVWLDAFALMTLQELLTLLLLGAI